MLNLTVQYDKNPVYASFDPGEATGAALFDEKGEIIGFYTIISYLQFVEFINQNCKECKLIVCEGFRPFEERALKKSEVKHTNQLIGYIKGFCMSNGIQYVEQYSDIKPTAEKWTGKKSLSAKDPARHQWDAFNHFMYWAIQKGLQKTKLEKQLERERNVQ